LRDHLLTFRYICFEALSSLSPHAAQGELENREQLQCRVVKLLRDAHTLGSANVFESGLIFRHLPDPQSLQAEYARGSLRVTNLLFEKQALSRLVFNHDVLGQASFIAASLIQFVVIDVGRPKFGSPGG
jgi:hypothetical protein